jgi:hypothetical protein
VDRSCGRELVRFLGVVCHGSRFLAGCNPRLFTRGECRRGFERVVDAHSSSRCARCAKVEIKAGTMSCQYVCACSWRFYLTTPMLIACCYALSQPNTGLMLYYIHYCTRLVAGASREVRTQGSGSSGFSPSSCSTHDAHASFLAARMSSSEGAASCGSDGAADSSSDIS